MSNHHPRNLSRVDSLRDQPNQPQFHHPTSTRTKTVEEAAAIQRISVDEDDVDDDINLEDTSSRTTQHHHRHSQPECEELSPTSTAVAAGFPSPVQSQTSVGTHESLPTSIASTANNNNNSNSNARTNRTTGASSRGSVTSGESQSYTSALHKQILKGISVKNPPDLISISVAKSFVHTFLDFTPGSVQDQAWKIAPNEIRRLFVLAPRVMLFAHRPLCSLCHPHLSTVAWRADLSTKLTNAEAGEDLIPWKVNAAIAQAQHLEQMALRGGRGGRGKEASVAAFHGAVVPPEASRAALNTKRFVSLVEAIHADINNFDEEILQIEQERYDQEGRKKRAIHQRRRYDYDGDDEDDDDEEENDDEEEEEQDDDDDDGTQDVILTKNLESGIYFASAVKKTSSASYSHNRKGKTSNRNKKSTNQQKRRVIVGEQESKMDQEQLRQQREMDILLQNDNVGDEANNTSRRDIPMSDRWHFLAELHAHVRLCSEKVAVHQPVPATSPEYNAMIHNILTTQLPAMSSAKHEATRCIDHWRTSPQIMGMLRSMFKRLATAPADPKVIQQNSNALKRSMSMNFGGGGSDRKNEGDGSTKAVLNVGAAMTPQDFDAEGGHLRRKLSRVFSSVTNQDSNDSGSNKNNNNTKDGNSSLSVEQFYYISVSSFVIFQQRLFATLYHATSDEQVICAALLDFIIDSDYIGNSSSQNNNYNNSNSSPSPVSGLSLKKIGSLIHAGGGGNGGDIPGVDDDLIDLNEDQIIDEDVAKRKREAFSKKSLNSFARLSSNALSKKLADEMAVAEEQRERERVLLSASHAAAARNKISISEMKNRMKEKVINVARQFNAATNQFVHSDANRCSSGNNIFKLTSTTSTTSSSKTTNDYSDGNNNTDNNNNNSNNNNNNNSQQQQNINNYADDLLVKSQHTVKGYNLQTSSNFGQQPSSRLNVGPNNLDSIPGSSVSATSSVGIGVGGAGGSGGGGGGTAVVAGISGGAKGLLQVRDFSRFGVFFEGFCKYMFELCDNWAASHSIDAVGAFLGLLCKVSFPYPIDTVWAKNLPLHLKNEQKLLKQQRDQQQQLLLSQQQQKRQQQKSDEGEDGADLDAAFDILEQQAADDAAAALLEGNDGKKGKPRRRGDGDILSSIIAASRKSARRNQINKNKAKDGSKKSGGKDNSNNHESSPGSLPQIVVHAPELANSQKGKDHSLSNSAGAGAKKQRKKVTFSIEISDNKGREYASDDEDDDEEEDVNHNNNNEGEDKKSSSALRASKRYAEKKYGDVSDVDSSTNGGSEENNDNSNSLQGLLGHEKGGDIADMANVTDPNNESCLLDNSSNFLESIGDSPSKLNNNHVKQGSSGGLLDVQNTSINFLSDTPQNQSVNYEMLMDSLQELPEMDEFDPNNNSKRLGANNNKGSLSSIPYKNPNRILSFSGMVSSDDEISPGAFNNNNNNNTHHQRRHSSRLNSLISSNESNNNDNSGLLPETFLLELAALSSGSSLLSRRKNSSASGGIHSKGDGDDDDGDDDDSSICSISPTMLIVEELKKRTQRDQANFLMELMRRRRERAVEANSQLHERHRDVNARRHQLEQEELQQLLLALRNAKDPVLERFSHLLTVEAHNKIIRDKDGNIIKEVLHGRTIKPFAERRQLYDIWLMMMNEGSNNMSNKNNNNRNNSIKSNNNNSVSFEPSRPSTAKSSNAVSVASTTVDGRRTVPSSAVGRRTIGDRRPSSMSNNNDNDHTLNTKSSRPTTSFAASSWIHQNERNHMRQLFPMMATTFDSASPTKKNYDENCDEAELAKRFLIKTMIVGGHQVKKPNVAPTTSSTATRMAFASSGTSKNRPTSSSLGGGFVLGKKKTFLENSGVVDDDGKEKEKTKIEIVY